MCDSYRSVAKAFIDGKEHDIDIIRFSQPVMRVEWKEYNYYGETKYSKVKNASYSTPRWDDGVAEFELRDWLHIVKRHFLLTDDHGRKWCATISGMSQDSNDHESYVRYVAEVDHVYDERRDDFFVNP